MQLNRIEQTLQRLFEEFHRDRLAEIFSGTDQFQKAMLFQDSTNRNQAILNAVQTLHGGIHKTLLELRNRIAEAPDPNSSSFLYHLAPWNNKTKKAAEMMRQAEESFRGLMIGIRTIAECYAVLGETGAAARTLSEYFDKVNSSNIAAAAEKARLVEFSGSTAPQEPWEEFLRVYPSVKARLETLSAAKSVGPHLETEIEFMPHELLGERNGPLSEM
jgi:hypothetical protein